jgi:hypothetical protein
VTKAETERLIDLCVADLRAAFKLPRIALLDKVLRRSAARFADEIIEFDNEVGRGGLLAGAAFILDRFTGSVTTTGFENLRSDGPLMLASNHPGMVDAMAIWSGLGRSDLKTLAADKPLLRLLPNTIKCLILIDGQGTHAIRDTVNHLRSGGAILTFPAGKIEPDPATSDLAKESLEQWSDSYSLFLRQVPTTELCPIIVSGVISRSALTNPLLRLLKKPNERAWAAATLQVLRPKLRNVPVTVRAGTQVSPSDLRAEAERLISES